MRYHSTYRIFTDRRVADGLTDLTFQLTWQYGEFVLLTSWPSFRFPPSLGPIGMWRSRNVIGMATGTQSGDTEGEVVLCSPGQVRCEHD
jgi:hypothetical protein